MIQAVIMKKLLPQLSVLLILIAQNIFPATATHAAAQLAAQPAPAAKITPSEEFVSFARALVGSAEVLAQLKEKGTTRLMSYTMNEIVPESIIQYEFEFQKTCFCPPIVAKVSVLEDLRPTFLTENAIYKTSVVFSE